jgi:hypothetical protein
MMIFARLHISHCLAALATTPTSTGHLESRRSCHWTGGRDHIWRRLEPLATKPVSSARLEYESFRPILWIGQ